ncbi:hypothetical protein GCM10009601_33000 [Streptomyces thermospinosisporus]|uniref:Uncharacterized protein n=1 Tax=Streptomyces thermospinosisporus TaxID=161482 RepID=A0ABP4JQH0_9ACTN
MRSRKASAKTPRAGSPAGTGASVAVQVRPRSAECSTRARSAPPVASQTSFGPAETRHWPPAAKPASPSGAGGMPSSGSTVQDRPPSRVDRMRNRPSTGSLMASPCRRSKKVRQS